jgi:hypothetical protein
VRVLPIGADTLKLFIMTITLEVLRALFDIQHAPFKNLQGDDARVAECYMGTVQAISHRLAQTGDGVERGLWNDMVSVGCGQC